MRERWESTAVWLMWVEFNLHEVCIYYVRQACTISLLNLCDNILTLKIVLGYLMLCFTRSLCPIY